jgi:hypothetical protein
MSVGGLETLEVNICDSCLVLQRDRVLHVTKHPQPATYDQRPWEPGD